MSEQAVEVDERGAKMTAALAEYFGTEPERVTGWVIGLEHNAEGGMTLSTGWSGVTPVWTLKGFLRQMLQNVGEQRG